MQHNPPNFPSNYEETPKSIKALTLATIFITLSFLLLKHLSFFLPYIDKIQKLFVLSRNALDSFFIWQLFTYAFIHSIPGEIPLSSIIHLFFNMSLLWLVGSSLYQCLGKKSFLRFYFLSAAAPGLATLFFIWLTESSCYLSGSDTCICAILTVWSMLFPDLELSLFFNFPIQAKTLIFGMVLFKILSSFAQNLFCLAFALLFSILFAYIYAASAWNLSSPFSFTRPLDKSLSKLGENFRKKYKKSQEIKKHIYKKAKIFDFNTGEAVIDDDEFIDIMLSKISLYGEKSLTWKERKKLKKISLKRKNKDR